MSIASRRVCATPFRLLHPVASSPRKIAKQRLERAHKINKITKSLFGAVDKNEFKSFAKTELAKFQEQAAHRWGFDFILDKPIFDSAEYQWEPMRLTEIPKTYQPTIAIPRQQPPSSCSIENICPIFLQAPALSSIIIHQQRNSMQTRKIASSCSQTKITDFLKVRKRSISFCLAPPSKKTKFN